MNLKDLVDKLDSLEERRGLYAGNVKYYEITVEMHKVEREIIRVIREIING